MPYAIIRDGQPVEIFAGQPFVTSQMKITTKEEAAWSFSPIGSVINVDHTHSPAALGVYDAADLARFCIHSFARPAAPEGKILESYALALEGDSVVAAGVFADPPVPSEVKRVQGRIQLRREGLLETVETAISSASDEIQEYWASTAIFRRDNAALIAMWRALGRTDDQLDTTFRAAALIEI